MWPFKKRVIENKPIMDRQTIEEIHERERVEYEKYKQSELFLREDYKTKKQIAWEAELKLARAKQGYWVNMAKDDEEREP